MNNSRNRITRRRRKRLSEEKNEITLEPKELNQCLEENLEEIRGKFGNSSDLIVRVFKMGKPMLHRAASIYIDGLADKKMTGSFIMERLMSEIPLMENEEALSPEQMGNFMKESLLPITKVEEIKNLNELFLLLLAGQTIVLVDGWNHALGCALEDREVRSITEPTSEVSIRGPKDSFTESLLTNTAMVRARIKSPSLWLETMKIGSITQTEVAIMYIKGIASEKLLREVKDRLNKIDVAEVLGSNTIEEWITDDFWTPLPTILVTERPDVVSGNLLEGRVTIFVDGTPVPLILPATFIQFFQSAEDYYLTWSIASFLRIIRVLSFFITLFGSSLFIAFVSFHPELIPTPLLINLASQREGIPFPVIIEALLMEFTFEILREAGLRMPRQVGQAVSIVGALVIGEAAVMAGIVSSAMVIIVAATAIASFTIPHYSMTDATRLMRFGMMILASLFGLYGVGLGAIALLAHTVSLRSFGIPYLTPMAPFNLSDQQDVIFRLPKKFLTKRPHLISQINVTRSGLTQNSGKTIAKSKGNNNE
ncbi:spore germination protein [Alteribacillus sp. HJP-4]|uniref:spore germination protein n=1 Tax=Alteribacillus sp. HJP-4 TaxID=2775394 RepID=UPI0035CD22AD